jgi:hypothetical protein
MLASASAPTPPAKLATAQREVEIFTPSASPCAEPTATVVPPGLLSGESAGRDTKSPARAGSQLLVEVRLDRVAKRHGSAAAVRVAVMVTAW